MLQALKRKSAQGVTVEYAVTFAVVLAVITAMTVYFKRVVQGRIVGARDYMGNTIDKVFQDPTLNLTGNFSWQYEPYYTETEIDKIVDGTMIDREIGGVGQASISEKEYLDYRTRYGVTSNQLAPRYAD